jgi:hypothetical protein
LDGVALARFVGVHAVEGKRGRDASIPAELNVI